ncbi:MAG: enoyl-CoA hydratase/isomerase family protein [Acidimicrobiales bacterium]
MADHPKPIIAAINGFAVGIGCLITLCCDILLAADNAELGLPQVPLGIIPAYGGGVRLARYVGRGKAMEMVLLGERITAEEGYRGGPAQQGGAPGRAVAAGLATMPRRLPPCPRLRCAWPRSRSTRGSTSPT